MSHTDTASSESPSDPSTVEAVQDANRLFDFAGIARCWGLAESEQRALLGDVSAETYERWRLGEMGDFETDVGSRLSWVFEIFSLLQNAFHDPVDADGWVRKPNDGLDGAQPLSLMLESDEGLQRVLTHLRALAVG